MKRFYVSSHHGLSGISKYSRDFYNLILKDEGYIHIDSSLHFSEIFSAISSRDYVHIEIGIFQKKEIEILMRMINAKYKYINVTLHDAPIIKYPFHDFGSPLLNKISKAYDVHWDSFAAAMPLVRKINNIYVLSKRGAGAVERKYMIENVKYLPHVIDTAEITFPSTINKNFIFFGFIGRNKGIEYGLRLHRELLERGFGGSEFYVVGTALGKEKAFYETLVKKYKENVHYLGYVSDEKIQEIFDKTTFALLPFRDYGFFHPFSGSVLQSIKKGKLVFTNNVNSVSEIIKDGETGFYLSGRLRKDADLINTIISNEEIIKETIRSAQDYIIHNHSPEITKKIFFNKEAFINN